MTKIARKKLIEISIPLEAINKASAVEKGIKVGKHTSIHQWFAPRPLATCRAVLFTQLVDDPSGWPDRFETAEKQEIERKRLHKVVERLVQWDALDNDEVLNEARWEIARTFAWSEGEEPPNKGDEAAILGYLQAKGPQVCDPFSGGASISLEAQRLGLRAYSSDLNPVAVLIGKSLVEIPPKFAGMPPVNQTSRSHAANGGAWRGRGAAGLADDVRYYAQWMGSEAARRLGHLYPKATLPDGKDATVVAWLWARTVRSPDPAAKGAMVPLISSFILSTKESRKTWVEVIIDPAAPDGYRFEVKTGVLSVADEERLKSGTKASRGNFACILTGAPIPEAWNRAEGKAHRLGVRMFAVVAEGKRQRIYLTPTQFDEHTALRAEPTWAPDNELFPQALGFRVPAYGLTKWSDLFTKRQLSTIAFLSELVSEARERVLVDTSKAEFPKDNLPLCQGGKGAIAYADAIATYLSFIVNKNAQTSNSLVRWFSIGEKAQPTFERQTVSMVFDFAEANVLGNSTGSFSNCTKYVSSTLEKWGGTGIGTVNQLAAQNLPGTSSFVICTDPPYYDNIGYADLSDFFYVWMRHSLSNIWPDLFRRIITPKVEELVATPFRHGGKQEADAFFMRGMGESLSAMRDASLGNVPLAIFYAFKQSEVASEGVTSAGWASFLQAIVDSGLSINGTWPMRTEHSSRLRGQASNALASSIVLVCRRRDDAATTATRGDFIRTLRRELPTAIGDIRKAGVGPVDMQQSVIGPGMSIFSSYARVLEDDDRAMPVKTALSLINRVWDEIENELTEAFDAPTQVALAWFATYGFEARPSGELITLANAKNIPLATLFTSGVFHNLGGKAGLVARADLPAGWSPVTDKAATIWECVQHTIRLLNAENGGAEAAAALVAQMGQRAEDARALAYRLFEIATQKGWSAEALIYNALAQEWPRLAEMAPDVIARGPVAAAQATLF